MPERRIAYACSFGCKRNVLTSKARMAEHESACCYNPKNRACITCGNLHTEMETKYDRYHGGNPGSTDTEYRVSYCDADESIDLNETLRRDCPLWRKKGSGEPQ